MKYLVTDNKGNKSIQDWDILYEDNANFHLLTQEQLEFLEENPNARPQEVEKCEIFSPLYFVFDQYNRKRIEVFEDDMRGNPAFVNFTQEQEEFYLLHPEASIWEVSNCRLYGEMQQEEEYIDIDEYKELKRKEMSALSLQTLGTQVSAYQLANAQCGVYDASKAEEVISRYKTIGSECRNLFYSFVDELTLLDDVQQINAICEKYEQRYKEIAES